MRDNWGIYPICGDDDQKAGRSAKSYRPAERFTRWLGLPNRLLAVPDVMLRDLLSRLIVRTQTAVVGTVPHAATCRGQ